jgi:hypothetical protein
LTKGENIMNLTKLLIIHAIVTLAAGIALIVAPDLIPSAVDIHIDPSAYLMCYLLGASELGIAFLSYYSKDLDDTQALRLISWTFIVFHASTAIVEVYAFMQGLSAAIWGNVALRVLVTILFAYYGVYKVSDTSATNK